MLSQEATMIIGFLQSIQRPANEYAAIPFAEKRRYYEENMLKATRLPKDTVIEPFTMGSLPAAWIMADHAQRGTPSVVLYLHGGGCVYGSCKTHHGIAAALSGASGCRVLLIEYRLAPEHPYPAAYQDCLMAYQWLLDQGFPGENIIIGGDSSGGALALMTLIALRDAKQPLPKAAFFLSLFGDFVHLDGETYQTNAQKDWIGNLQATQADAQYFVGNMDPKPQILSPIRCDLSGLPPLLIQAAGDEIVLSDSLRLAERAKQAGVQITLEIWEGMWHFFQSFSAIVPEARQAVEQVGAFITAQFQGSKP